MSDFIGRVPVPEIAVSGVFPIVSDFPHGRAQAPQVVLHRFGSVNAKIEQRFLLGSGARRFTVERSKLRESERAARLLGEPVRARRGPLHCMQDQPPQPDLVTWALRVNVQRARNSEPC